MIKWSSTACTGSCSEGCGEVMSGAEEWTCCCHWAVSGCQHSQALSYTHIAHQHTHALMHPSGASISPFTLRSKTHTMLILTHSSLTGMPRRPRGVLHLHVAPRPPLTRAQELRAAHAPGQGRQNI